MAHRKIQYLFSSKHPMLVIVVVVVCRRIQKIGRVEEKKGGRKGGVIKRGIVEGKIFEAN